MPLPTKRQEEIREKWLEMFYENQQAYADPNCIFWYFLQVLNEEVDKIEQLNKQDKDWAVHEAQSMLQ